MSEMIYKSELKTKMIMLDFFAPSMTTHEFVENELHSVDADLAKHGEWIEDENGIHCSRCDAECEYLMGDTLFNYCPYCGAEMEQKEMKVDPNEVVSIKKYKELYKKYQKLKERYAEDMRRLYSADDTDTILYVMGEDESKKEGNE